MENITAPAPVSTTTAPEAARRRRIVPAVPAPPAPMTAQERREIEITRRAEARAEGGMESYIRGRW